MMSGGVKKLAQRFRKDEASNASPKKESSKHDQASTTSETPKRKEPAANAPRVLVIGAGSRGTTYARCMTDDASAVVVAIAEPHDFKRQEFGRRYIWGDAETPPEGSCFMDWREFVAYEKARRKAPATDGDEKLSMGVDAAFVCVQDEQHREVVEALAPFGIHIMCEKPLATSLEDCLAVFKALRSAPKTVFGIGHVLRYSPHNLLLRKLLVQDKVIGDILSVVHTEPVGYWHFAHSYVRGNWRRTDTSAPSLLTKSCHDIDILLWLMCSPPTLDHPSDAIESRPHLPSTVTSTGSLQLYRKSRKPKKAGDATNCLSCPIEEDCKFSAKKIYIGKIGLQGGNKGWPVKIVLPEIEDYGLGEAAEMAMVERLSEDYKDGQMSDQDIKKRNWFGRCVYESDNDVCDEQVVTITWDEDPLPIGSSSSGSDTLEDPMCGRGSKQATFHMVAHTNKICDRYSHFYGTEAELEADSNVITVTDFSTGRVEKHYPSHEVLSHHGGGDNGLTRQFISAVDMVNNEGWEVERAQREMIGCTVEECIRSHAMVFAAEDARTGKKVIDWADWWEERVESML
ncbi:putative streptomycin biosynthesis protein [Zalerion maritima]|uniref:Streptomycin biosynthesis protein n=1 Tax=Zalerion maritima TaxID=339359 RepID=A0AAD5RPU3_9PEZI|nr:putative streptomycin biosynthesis protein [Zalerion maritima]